MENTSKALLIAAGVLIVIILITLGIRIFSSINSVDESAKHTGNAILERTKDATTIAIGEINGGQENKDKIPISKTDSYVGYYADVDGNGTVDGVIYADLAIGNTGDGQWNNANGNYKINKISNAKDYYISQINYEGVFGTKDVLCSIGNGNDRFYVMALTDLNSGTYYCWYDAAYGNMSDYITTTSVKFGTGKQNTLNMIEKWNNKAYGAQNDNGTYKDMWGEIQAKVNEGWFIPSRGEWSAFGEELGIISDDYVNSYYYCWSSSQSSKDNVWYIGFDYGYNFNINVDYNCKVRLSKIF